MAFRINLPGFGAPGAGIQIGQVGVREVVGRGRNLILIRNASGRISAVRTAPRRRPPRGRGDSSDRLMKQLLPIILIKMVGGH